MALIVQKFGGSSVKDRDRIFNVARIVANTHNAGNDVVVVVSAQGDTTDDLIAKAGEITHNPSAREMDMLLASGEQISIALLAMALNELGCHAISLTGWQAGFRTDRAYTKARITRLETERISSELERNRVVVVAGFQGLNKLDDITTLGRGGSDTSAVAIAAALLMTLAMGCNNQPIEPDPEPDPEFPVTVGSVTLTEAPAAVVSLSPATTEMIYDLGYADRLVGVSEYCTTPVAAAKPRMGSAYQPDVDKIKASGAQLVLCTVQPTESILLELQQAGAQVLVLPRAATVDGIKQNYRALGMALAGNVTGSAEADAIGTMIDTKLAEAAAALSAAGRETAPDATLLISYPYRMATGDTLEGKLLEQVGFHCSGAEYTDWLYPESELAALEPDVIFCAEADEVETVKQSYEYKVVAAVKNDKVMAVDFTAFQNQSLRLFDTLIEMARFAAGTPAEQ